MTPFDHARLQQLPINEVEPYGFWTWETAGRRGGMVCFRGVCRAGPDGEKDLRVIDWWMVEVHREAGGLDGLVVDAIEFGGNWHDRLTFLPPVPLRPTFRVLYSVTPYDRARAVELWGESRVRGNLDTALAEMDGYLAGLGG